MKKYKHTAALSAAICFALSLYGCAAETEKNGGLNSFASSAVTMESDSIEQTVSESFETDSGLSGDMQDQSAADQTEAAELGEIVLIGDEDITSDGSLKQLYGIDLYESRGGKIKFEQCEKAGLYDTLAEKTLAGEPADTALFDNGMVYPYACVNRIFQPIDGLVDFNSEEWSDVKGFADNFELNGWHYTAPAAVLPEDMFYYSKSAVEQLGKGNPRELYSEGKWNRSVCESMMRAFADSGDGKYGAAGDYAKAFFLSTGQTLVGFEKDTESFYTNIFNSELSAAADFLYALKNDGVCYDGLASTNDCVHGDLLFYVGKSELSILSDSDIEAVPPPCSEENGKSFWQASVTAFMWVSGSDSSDEMKVLLECSRIAGKARTEKYSYPDTENAVYDFSNGISDRLSDPDQNKDFGDAVIPFIYSAPCEVGEWSSICGYFSDALTVELSIINNKYIENSYQPQ